MKDSPYNIIPLHTRPELMKQCCALINSEWPRSETARLRTLSMSCDEFPICLVLLNRENVIGHCKISLIPNMSYSCFIESTVIDHGYRHQGLGSMLMRGAEEYVVKKGIKSVYLTTKNQETFYLKNGYSICEPIRLYGYTNFINSTIVAKEEFRNTKPTGPSPPPMPTNTKKSNIPISSSKTYMMKQL